MTPRVRMESSVAASREHGSVVTHRKTFHAAPQISAFVRAARQRSGA
jgi:phage gp16-like protein